MTDPALALGMVSAGVALAGGTALFVPPTRRLAPRVRPYLVSARARFGRGPGGSHDLHADVTAHSIVRRVLGPPVTALFRRVGSLLERRTDESLAATLRHAGFRDVLPDAYRVRVALHVFTYGLGGAVLGAVVFHDARAGLALGVCGVLFGASRLRGRLDREIAERRERMRIELYTVNQLLAIHVRTGAGPVQATQRIVDRGSGLVVDELDDVLASMHTGVAEPEAFRRAAELTPEPAAARTYKLCAAASERGVDLADGLRALSEDLRDARREEIRQTATRRRAAMLVPTIAVLAPVMLLFIAAPLPSIVFGRA